MNFASIAALSFAMSTDAFAAAIAKGAALHRPTFCEALRTGLIFGVIEGVTPIIGWLLAKIASPYVSAWNHWIAFVLLSILGALMMRAGFKTSDEEKEKPASHSFWTLAVTGLATSVDAMVIGAGVAFIDVDIAVIAAAIAASTFTMVTLGVMLGRGLGLIVGKRAEIVGGLTLIAIGSSILYENLVKVTLG